MFILETHAGTPYELGLDHGRKFRHVIQGNIHAWCFCQPFQASDQEMEELIAPARNVLSQWSPESVEELQGIAAGSQVEFTWIERMHFRIWNRLQAKAAAKKTADAAPAGASTTGCTGVGMVTQDRGTILGGTLDDPRQSFVLALHRPRGKRAYVQTRWAGVLWGHNGVNESGLALVEQSVGGFDKPVPIDDEAGALYNLAGPRVLQQCDTVAQAIELLQKWPGQDSLILADRTGDVAAVCNWGRKAFVQRPDRRGMVWNSNQVHIEEALAMARQHGAKPASRPYTQTRHDYLAKFADEHAGKLMASHMEEVLRTPCGFPHSVCNDGTVNATIAPVQAEPGVMYVADRPPSRNPFVRYAVG